jgi:hypothetical protein
MRQQGSVIAHDCQEPLLYDDGSDDLAADTVTKQSILETWKCLPLRNL